MNMKHLVHSYIWVLAVIVLSFIGISIRVVFETVFTNSQIESVKTVPGDSDFVIILTIIGFYYNNNK